MARYQDRTATQAERGPCVTGDVTIWDVILSVGLTCDVEGSINLDEVKTGRSPGWPVALIRAAEATGRNKHTSISPSLSILLHRS